MPSLKVTVLIEQDGQERLRLMRRLSVTDAVAFQYTKANGGGYVTLPIGELAAVSVLAVEAPEQAVTLRLDGQSDAGISLNAGGFLLVVDGNLDAGASTNATLDNSSGSDAPVRGLAGGT